MRLKKLAESLGGQLVGAGSVDITGLASLSDAVAGDLAFLANPKYISEMSTTNASAVLVNKDWTGECSCAVIKVDNADESFSEAAKLVLPFLLDDKPLAGVHNSAVIADDVEIGSEVSVGPNVVLEQGVKVGDRSIIGAGSYIGRDVIIGDDCRIYPNVSIRERTQIGDRVIIHCGAVVGSDGFGYSKDGAKWKKIPQVGIVVLGNDVEIGANANIDRARFGKTILNDGVKVDNLVQIAHNVQIGENTAMASQVGISGSTKIGKNVQLGGQAGLAGHLNVGDNAVVGAQAGVTKDVDPASFVSGYPAMPHKKAALMHAHFMRLPDLKARVAALERKLKD